MSFLNTKIKNLEEDSDKKWITTQNDYLHRIKHFFRWLYNQKDAEAKGLAKGEVVRQEEWETPTFARIREKRSKRISPYLETESCERDELLSLIKYEPYKRNKAALALFWDLDARNHEVTVLKIKHIRFRERYGEGEIPHESKTSTGPILLTLLFPYVRDWLNEHPIKNTADALVYVIFIMVLLLIKPKAMWMMMKQLCNTIIRMLKDNSITDNEERQKLEYQSLPFGKQKKIWMLFINQITRLSDLLEKLKPSFEQLPEGRIIKWLSLKYSSQAVKTVKTNFGLG